MLIAALTAIRSIPDAMNPPIQGEAAVSYVIGLYLVPFLLLIAARALSRSKLVESPGEAAEPASTVARD